MPRPGSDGERRKSLRPNNFDLIRLLAAFQVLVYHSKWLLLGAPAGLTAIEAARRQASDAALGPKVESAAAETGPQLFGLLQLIFHSFSGVPIFFVVSGFLVTLSLEKSPDLKAYFTNRALRIYPGLWLALVWIVGAAFIAGYGADILGGFGSVLGWIGVQGLGFFNELAEPLKAFGHGHANSPLWTIQVELEFYLMAPLVYWIGRKFGLDAVLWIVLIVGTIFNQFMPPTGPESPWITQFLGHPAFRVFWMFVLGAIARRNFERIRPLVEGKFLIWMAAHLGLVAAFWLLQGYTGFDVPLYGNRANPLAMIVLTGVILSAAYSMPGLSDKLLKGTDISYGMYVLHVPVICLMLEFGVPRPWGFLGTVVGATILSYISWKLIEKPALALKKYSSRKETAAPPQPAGAE